MGDADSQSTNVSTSPPGTAKPGPPVKHPLDYLLAFVTILSLLLNVYLLYDRKNQQAIEQPGPRLFRLFMPASEALIFYNLKEKRDLLFAAFPNPAFTSSPTWQAALDSAETKSPLELTNEAWAFLVVQNFTSNQYVNVILDSRTGGSLTLGSIDPQSTRFVYCEGRCEDAVRVKYQLLGDADLRSSEVPAPTGAESRLITELDMTRLGSLDDVSDRVKALIRSKQSVAQGF